MVFPSGKVKCFRKDVEIHIALRQVQRGAVIETITGGISAAGIRTDDMRPLDADGRIVPRDAALIARCIEICHLIAELCDVGEHEEAMCESRGDVELKVVVLGKLHAIPLTEGLAALTQVNCNVEDSPADAADQLSLRVFLLKMKPAQHALCRGGLVVLDKDHIQTGFLHVAFVVGFCKIASLIAVYSRQNGVETIDWCLVDCNLSHVVRMILSLHHAAGT